ncbi:hypothetical protein A3Q56_03968 [Intoshia linei]|uniref:ALMS motif domain-containing protein n=1 Tax=Intoshia linei TaxID=1819745 RepID=A0A177B1Z1_9BILA|nr:hypothetical protein A3Q56_03968 [Intoshia linei]
MSTNLKDKKSQISVKSDPQLYTKDNLDKKKFIGDWLSDNQDTNYKLIKSRDKRCIKKLKLNCVSDVNKMKSNSNNISMKKAKSKESIKEHESDKFLSDQFHSCCSSINSDKLKIKKQIVGTSQNANAKNVDITLVDDKSDSKNFGDKIRFQWDHTADVAVNQETAFTEWSDIASSFKAICNLKNCDDFSDSNSCKSFKKVNEKIDHYSIDSNDTCNFKDFIYDRIKIVNNAANVADRNDSSSLQSVEFEPTNIISETQQNSILDDISEWNSSFYREKDSNNSVDLTIHNETKSLSNTQSDFSSPFQSLSTKSNNKIKIYSDTSSKVNMDSDLDSSKKIKNLWEKFMKENDEKLTSLDTFNLCNIIQKSLNLKCENDSRPDDKSIDTVESQDFGTTGTRLDHNDYVRIFNKIECEKVKLKREQNKQKKRMNRINKMQNFLDHAAIEKIKFTPSIADILSQNTVSSILSNDDFNDNSKSEKITPNTTLKSIYDDQIQKHSVTTKTNFKLENTNPVLKDSHSTQTKVNFSVAIQKDFQDSHNNELNSNLSNGVKSPIKMEIKLNPSPEVRKSFQVETRAPSLLIYSPPKHIKRKNISKKKYNFSQINDVSILDKRISISNQLKNLPDVAMNQSSKNLLDTLNGLIHDLKKVDRLEKYGCHINNIHPSKTLSDNSYNSSRDVSGSLQEAFNDKCKKFIKNSKNRQESIESMKINRIIEDGRIQNEKIEKLKALIQQHNDERRDKLLNKMQRQKDVPTKYASLKKMKNVCKKKYQNLPEVVNKQKMIQRKMFMKECKLRENLFNRKVLENLLNKHKYQNGLSS